VKNQAHEELERCYKADPNPTTRLALAQSHLRVGQNQRGFGLLFASRDREPLDPEAIEAISADPEARSRMLAIGRALCLRDQPAARAALREALKPEWRLQSGAAQALLHHIARRAGLIELSLNGFRTAIRRWLYSHNLPRKERTRIPMLYFYRAAVPPDARISEQRLKNLIEAGRTRLAGASSAWTTPRDTALMLLDDNHARRYLVQYGLLDRTQDGRQYWRSDAYLERTKLIFRPEIDAYLDGWWAEFH
jgi:hypothetical protein